MSTKRDLAFWHHNDRRFEDDARRPARSGLLRNIQSYEYAQNYVRKIRHIEAALLKDKSRYWYGSKSEFSKSCHDPYDIYLDEYLYRDRKGFFGGKKLTLAFKFRFAHARLAWEYLRRSEEYRNWYGIWANKVMEMEHAFRTTGEDRSYALSLKTAAQELEATLCAQFHLDRLYGLVDPDTNIPPVFRETRNASSAVDVSGVWKDGSYTPLGFWDAPYNGIQVVINATRPREELMAEFTRRLELLIPTDGQENRGPLPLPQRQHDKKRPLSGPHARNLLILDTLLWETSSATRIHSLLIANGIAIEYGAAKESIKRAKALAKKDYIAIATRCFRRP